MKFLRCVVFLLLGLSISIVQARVTRVEVASRVDVLGGKAFGDAGSYERITGRVYFSLPVANAHNRGIVDLDKAVNLKDGEVEFSADFVAIRPKDASKGNGSMLLEVPNRGRPRITGLVDGGDWDVSTDAGDAWLLRNGFTIVSARMAVGCGRRGRSALLCADREGKRRYDHRFAARRPDAVRSDAGNSAGPPDPRQHRRQRISRWPRPTIRATS